MTSDEIRRTYLQFFEERDHQRVRSGSLIPSGHDPSALFTVAGMHPLKPYFLGTEQPPHPRLTSCQKTFRTADIDIIGTTTGHLTFFEMLGNFSLGDYFKQGAAEYAWELSTQGFGFDGDEIWITVFGGDDELGIGPDEEAIEAWLEIGVPRERIVECPRSENWWELPPPGPCGPCSELYLDRGLSFGKADDLPGGDNERFLEYWNLVFMQFNQDPVNTLAPLPAKNIDTGLGLNRLAAILQGKETVFETDQFAPLIELGEELSGRRYGAEFATDRALRVLADHSRAMSFLIADGVVPSNEDRGYVLRRVMRRAILQGRQTLTLDPGFLGLLSERVTELMGAEYPELREQREAIQMWLAAEEENFGRTLEQGLKRLEELIERARQQGEEGISADDAFLLHDTFGFPFDLTRELVAEHDLGVSDEGFELLMEGQRARARSAARGVGVGAEVRAHAAALAGEAGFATEFLGYQTTDLETTVGAAVADDDRVLVKLVESPFYATGGGQVADSGYVECADGDCRARVDDVFRLGDDQVVALVPERGALEVGERVHAVVDRATRHATECNHTATHLLHAALRRRLGSHVRQAGSYVGPDKLRFDFTHGSALAPEELRDVEDQVNAWIFENQPVRWLTTTLDEAKRLGAMALFGEKYGDVVRMVEVGDGSFSRELCGGTHVHATAEIGVFKITAETSSAANVRRIEALTGPGAVKLLRGYDEQLSRAAVALRVPPTQVADAVAELRARVRELERKPKAGANGAGGAIDIDTLLAAAAEVAGVSVLTSVVDGVDQDGLLGLADRLKGRLGDAAIVLGSAAEGRVALVANVSPAVVDRGVRADAIVRVAAELVGGGGGGRDTLARAGGRDPEKLPDALAAAREAIETALTS
ncbi:MAG TPA: alanine--tRNA ligase [Solirubrobacteraceae bacterium]|jgi:alanyl-tRNA synthetase|nr:alanine--tRNA ligase [Solirubrobacteraceae bacterium]